MNIRYYYENLANYYSHYNTSLFTIRPNRTLILGLCDVDKKNYHYFLIFFSISILITTLTQTDMLYSYKCILCEFETYFQRKPIRPFPKSCNMSLEQTYGKVIYIYILYVYVSNQIQQNMQHTFLLVTKSLSCSELIFPVSLAYYLSVCPVCSVLALNLDALHSDWFG